MRIDAVAQWLSKRKYVAVGISVGLFFFIFLVAICAYVQNPTGPGKEIRYRRHAADDDEIHDDEILAAVRSSINDWERGVQAKARLQNSHRVKRDEEIVCYAELGCFRDEGPFDYLDMLPSSPEEISTKFQFITRKNLQAPLIFSYFNFTGMSGSTHFNASLPTKVIIHGFGSTCTRMWAQDMYMAILQVVDANVICVDWENGAALPNYVRAAVNTRLVGKQVALLIFWLNEKLKARTEDFHLIGFSLGAHVAGFTGQELQNLSRITGLDPAGPLFESYDPKVRLDSSDALFVDVIHSNGDSLLMGGLGSWEPMGHVDFYPNGGRVQKGCSNLFLGAVRDFLWSASEGDGRSLCNHRRAYKFFTESLSNRCRFPAFSCDSYDKFLAGGCFTWDNNRCGDMGYFADRLPNPNKGLLYLITRDDEPFCANQFRITVESSPSSASISTYGGLEAILIGHDSINETFLVTQSLKDNMVAGNVIQRMIVAHPAITEPVSIQLKYTAYQGWLYSGISRWSMDRLILTNAYGKSMSFCTRILLPSGIPVTIILTAGVCIPTRFPPIPPNPVVPRPIYHPPYETHPTPAPPHNNTTGANGTSAPPLSDLDMQPPLVTSVQNVPSSSLVGPSYQHMKDGVDWSNWQPLTAPFRPFSPANGVGTPVEFFPAVDEETTTSNNEITTDPEENTLSPPTTTTGFHQSEADTTIANTAQTPSTELIRICNIVNSTLNSASLACVALNESRAGLSANQIQDPEGHALSATNQIQEPEHHAQSAANQIQEPEHNALSATNQIQEPEGHAHSAESILVQSTDLSIPPKSFWTAMHNQTLAGIGGAGADSPLPPHLSYILQQLESQGFGPGPDAGKFSQQFGGLANSLRSGAPTTRAISAAHAPTREKLGRGLVPSSRALKHRPVALSNRRQSKLLDDAQAHGGFRPSLHHHVVQTPIGGGPSSFLFGAPQPSAVKHPVSAGFFGQPKGYYLVPHFHGYSAAARRFKFRRIATSVVSPTISAADSGGGAAGPIMVGKRNFEPPQMLVRHLPGFLS